MYFLLEPFTSIRDFLYTGGQVLWVILLITIVLWTLIIERYWYMGKIFPAYVESLSKKWQAREIKNDWYAHKIREYYVAEVKFELNRNLGMIKTIIALCPLLGLLGTVTGIIHVFDVMAAFGTGNARAMASGVYMATIPTMAGLVSALSGFYFSARLSHRASLERERFNDLLRFYED
ncbi:MAG: MotA/TolQ/ExbB proton channel family protein [Gammaproteobacteria bacterium]|nr:MotA/TolQ/ExbB proton channel family protein [Gammaproteobacteria bacterium]